VTNHNGRDSLTMTFTRDEWRRIRSALHACAVRKPGTNADMNELRGRVEAELRQPIPPSLAGARPVSTEGDTPT
jgi:hypothetical protein